MSKRYFLTNVPCNGKLDVSTDAHFYWDGKNELILSLNGFRKTIALHYRPGDAFKAVQEGKLVKLWRLEVPRTLPGVVLWACHVEKGIRSKYATTFHRKLERFKSTHRILEPEPGFSPIWKARNRVTMEQCTGPFLFLIQEEKLQIARYAKHRGTMWATIAAYCDPDISKDEAWEIIRKHGIVEVPYWYIDNAVHDASDEDTVEGESG